MITDWRAKFREEVLPFLFVQLAAYPDNNESNFPALRWAQTVSDGGTSGCLLSLSSWLTKGLLL